MNAIGADVARQRRIDFANAARRRGAHGSKLTRAFDRTWQVDLSGLDDARQRGAGVLLAWAARAKGRNAIAIRADAETCVHSRTCAARALKREAERSLLALTRIVQRVALELVASGSRIAGKSTRRVDARAIELADHARQLAGLVAVFLLVLVLLVEQLVDIDLVRRPASAR